MHVRFFVFSSLVVTSWSMRWVSICFLLRIRDFQVITALTFCFECEKPLLDLQYAERGFAANSEHPLSATRLPTVFNLDIQPRWCRRPRIPEHRQGNATQLAGCILAQLLPSKWCPINATLSCVHRYCEEPSWNGQSLSSDRRREGALISSAIKF